MLMELLHYVGNVLAFCLLVALFGLGLVRCSEELEAHTVAAKRYITRYIYGVLVLHALLWLVDGLPLLRTLWAMLVNYQYLHVMASFPVVQFASASFLLACAGTVSNHFAWFWYFNDDRLPPYSIRDRVPGFQGETLPPFGEIVAFFSILVWAVPVVLILSLSANDNTLPMDNGRAAPPRKGLARVAVERALQFAADAVRGLFASERDVSLGI